MTARNEMERRALEMLEELRKQGKEPHGYLREVLTEMALREMDAEG